MLTVHNRHATARIALHGGQVLSFCPKGGADLLFLSDLAVFQPGKAIRGGVPVCWPWFGADPLGLGRPAHGLARTRAWHLQRSATLPGGETLVELGLTDSADTRALWPHAFDLTLEITVGATLSLVLTTRNTGNSPFQITQALHSYFAVGDIARTTVVGLDGCHYIDKAYTDAPASLAVVDGALQRRIALQVQGSRTAVVWNPWAAIAAGMADLDDDGYQRFVCVETANAADEVITVPPGGEHRLAVEIAVTPH
ncbi:MAG: D-hexose-6-phosphate mutarotase [Hydrogenophaga sp.]|nr:D-hexose-6-phosphate mutarotase [Hydrogenophaga sp.]